MGEVTKVKLKKLGVLSFAKFEAVLMALFGLIFGISSAIFSTSLSGLFGSAGFGFELGALSIIVFPIVYGIVGFILGLIGALIYNFISRIVSGIEMEFEE